MGRVSCFDKRKKGFRRKKRLQTKDRVIDSAKSVAERILGVESLGSGLNTIADN